MIAGYYSPNYKNTSLLSKIECYLFFIGKNQAMKITTFSIPTNQPVTINQEQFSDLLVHLTHTTENHLIYIEDDSVTKNLWHGIKYNGFTDKDFHTVEAVAWYIHSRTKPCPITKLGDKILGNVIEQLFDSIKVHYHYYVIAKVNPHSVQLQCLDALILRTLQNFMKICRNIFYIIVTYL